MIFRAWILLVGLLAVEPVWAQLRGKVSMCVVDSLTREAIIGAVAAFEPAEGEPSYNTSNVEGELSHSLPYGNYCLTLTSLGYDSLRMQFRLNRPLLHLDTLRMHPRAEQIDDVVVEATAVRTAQRGDTLIYNASAYKTAFGSDASTLLQKMPGIEVLDNGLEAQGRTIYRVYVDGREFFGNDVMAAVRNIPSDMIQSIEVYNAQSDESEMAGIDLGDGRMALNIVTRPDKRHGVFGRLYGGYGFTDKYIGGGNANIFHDDQRITVVGMANNISRRNFSFDNILGTTDAAAGSAGRDFKVNEMAGLSDVQALGLNYGDDWGKKAKITASYFFNRTGNENHSDVETQNFSSSDRTTWYDDHNDVRRQDIFHRFRSRLDYRPHSRHRFMMRLNASATDNHTFTEMLRQTDHHYDDGNNAFVSNRHNFTTNRSDYFQVDGSLAYTYRLPGKLLRSITLSVGGSLRKNYYLSDPYQYTFKEESLDPLDTTQYSSRSIRHIDRDRPSHTLTTTLTYTHAFSKRARMSLSYQHALSHALYDYSVWLFNNKEDRFEEERNQKQSTEYDYDYITDRLGATYQYTRKKTRVAATLYYQHVNYRSDYRFPYESQTRSSFNDLTYNVVANIPLNRRNRIRIDANSRTNNPPAGDLQSIVNTTNSQYVFAGNPDLEPVYTHRVLGEYVRTSATKGRTFTLSAEYVTSPNSIVDSLVVDNPDFVIDDEGNRLGEGNQYAKPINLSGFRNLRMVVTYGLPVRFLSSNLNLRADINYGQRPTMINDLRANLRNDAYGGTITLGSNISEQVDFTLSYMGRYQNNTTTSRGQTLDNAFFRQRIKGDFTAVLWRRLVLRSNAIYNSYRGITDSFHEQRLIVNAMIGVKLFRQELGELSFGVNDLLDENSSTFSRTASGTTLRSVTNTAIGRFYQVQFTYHLRHYRRVKVEKLME